MAITSIKFLGDTVVDNVHGQDHMLSYAELLEEDSRYLVSATSSSRVPIPPNRLWTSINSKKISNTRSIVSYYDNTSNIMKLRLFDETGTTVGSVVDIPDSDDVSCGLVQLSTNFFMVTYSADGVEGRVRTFTTTSDTIAFVQEETFASVIVSDLTAIKLDDGKVVIGYKDATNDLAYLQVITYTISTIQVNLTSATAFNGVFGATHIHCGTLTTTRGICFFTDSENNEARNFLFDVSGTTITINPEFIIDSNEGDHYDIVVISDTKVAFTYIGASDYLYFGITSIAENVVNNSNIKTIHSNTTVTCDLSRIGTTNYYIVTYSDGSNCEAQIMQVDSDYNIITEDLISVLTNDVDSISTVNTGNTSMTIFYNDTGNTNYGSASLITDINITSTIVDREATWITDYTSFLANFEQSLNSGNVDYDITSFKLKRKAEDGNFYITLGTYAGSTTSYVDTKPRNNVSYHYILYSLDSNGNEDLGTEVDGEVDFYGWFLTDGTNIYRFDLGQNSVSTSAINTNKDIQLYQNYTKYPTVGIGNRNYKTSSLQTIPYSYNSTSLEYEFTVDLLNELQEFIDNGEVKWLKNTKGEIFKCVTSNFTYKYYDEIMQQPYEIAFNWVEVGIGEEGLS